MSIVAKNGFDEAVTPDVLQRAVALGRNRKSGSLHAEFLRYLPETRSLTIEFADHTAIVLPVENYPELAALTGDELLRLDLCFAGSAVCLNDRDLHVSIAGLMAMSQPLLAAAKTVTASYNGSLRSAAKSAASRENGKKGGRPRRIAISGVS
uniref:ORF151 n=1 Tax=Leptospirillum ferrooxidans TaxID=180 RepID=Q58KF7_9BACT|nr:DUF2442 domain-containing protein [Leptospirillum ferrooxidans]AAX36044.1 ORF151 [Leptospirillum ferrooxidans]